MNIYDTLCVDPQRAILAAGIAVGIGIIGFIYRRKR